MTREEQKRIVFAFRDGMSNGRVSPEVRRDANTLFTEASRRLLAYCGSRLDNAQRAEEVAQEAFETAYGKLHDFRGDAMFTTWLIGFARFGCMAERRRTTELVEEDRLMEEASTAQRTALHELRERERLQLLREARRALDEVEQEAITLRYELECSQAEVGEILAEGEPASGRAILQRARRHLKRELYHLLNLHNAGTSIFRSSEPG